jgi:hypothetical protein
LPEYTNGVLTGWWRNTAIDPSRGANQQGVQAGTDYGFEYVPADKINGGEPSSGDIEYRTGGTSIEQNKPRGGALLEKIVPLALAAMAGGAGAEQLGLFGPGGFNGLTGLGTAAEAVGSAMPPLWSVDPIIGADAAAALLGGENAALGGMGLGTGSFVPSATTSLGGFGGAATSGMPPLWNVDPIVGADAAAATLGGESAALGGMGAGTGAFVPSAAESLGGFGGAAGSALGNAANAAGNASGLLSNVPDWLKQWGPLLGGLALGAESYLNKGDEQPQDPFTRDWARGLLSNPRSSADAMAGLKAKKYY